MVDMGNKIDREAVKSAVEDVIAKMLELRLAWSSAWSTASRKGRGVSARSRRGGNTIRHEARQR